MKALHSGDAFGLTFTCTRALPELASREAQDFEHGEWVEIDWGEELGAPADRPGQHALQATFESLDLGVAGVARYAVTADRIKIAPEPAADEASVRAFLFGSAVGALLHLRQIAVLHASAVRLADGSAALICGAPGAGKSTLAAALSLRGLVVLADDISAIRFDGQGRAWCQPGLARMKLWRNALTHLGLEEHALPAHRVRPNLDKYSLALGTAGGECPVRWVHELRVMEDCEVGMAPVTGLSKLEVLRAHTFRPAYLYAMGRQPQLLRHIAALAPQVKMTHIDRPRHAPTLDEICERLEHQWAH